MIVLDEHRVEQTSTMIAPTTATHCILLQPPPAGSRLSRIVDSRPSSLDSSHILARKRSDARQPTHKIQYGPFAGQHISRIARDLRDNTARGNLITITCQQ